MDIRTCSYTQSLSLSMWLSFINVWDEGGGLDGMLKRGSLRSLAWYARNYTAPWRTSTVRQHDLTKTVNRAGTDKNSVFGEP